MFARLIISLSICLVVVACGSDTKEVVGVNAANTPTITAPQELWHTKRYGNTGVTVDHPPSWFAKEDSGGDWAFYPEGEDGEVRISLSGPIWMCDPLPTGQDELREWVIRCRDTFHVHWFPTISDPVARRNGAILILEGTNEDQMTKGMFVYVKDPPESSDLVVLSFTAPIHKFEFYRADFERMIDSLRASPSS